MKNLSLAILMLWSVSSSCQIEKNIKLCHIKISPIGNSDVPRDTLFIGLTSTDFPKNEYFINLILTDELTLQHLIYFLKSYNYRDSSSKKRYYEYGCFNMSVYNRKSLVTGYNLDRLESVKYLQSLVDLLIKNKLDPKMIQNLKRALGEIDY